MSANKVLIPFDLLFDMDIGIMNTIKKEVPNENYFYVGLMNNAPIEWHKRHLYTRTDPNPVSLYANKDVLDDDNLDTLYTELLENYYNEIVMFSTPTNVLKLLNRFWSLDNNEMINAYVVYREPCELEQIKRFMDPRVFKASNVIKHNNMNLSDVDISTFDTIFMKYYYEVLLFNPDDLGGKNIIVSTHGVNMIEQANEKVLDPRISIQISDKVVVSTVDIYDISDDQEDE